jgi:hypothetical protein
MTLVLDRGFGPGTYLAYCQPDASGRSQYVQTVAEGRAWAESIGLRPLQWRWADDRLAQPFSAE